MRPQVQMILTVGACEPLLRARPSATGHCTLRKLGKISAGFERFPMGGKGNLSVFARSGKEKL